MAREMRRLELLPDLVLVSSARRTLQTLSALEPWQDPPQIVPLDALYLAPASDLLEALQRATPPRAACCWWGTTRDCTTSP